MSRRTEFSDDVVLYSHEDECDEPEDDEYDPFHETDLDAEAWQDWHSEHLLNMYMSMVEYNRTQGLVYFDKISFHMFCNFIYAHYK